MFKQRNRKTKIRFKPFNICYRKRREKQRSIKTELSVKSSVLERDRKIPKDSYKQMNETSNDDSKENQTES